MFLEAASSRRPRDGQLLRDNDDHHPRAYFHPRIGIHVGAFDERHKRGTSHDLVGKRVHEFAEVGDEIARPGDAAIQEVGDSRQAEKNQGQRVVVRETGEHGPKKHHRQPETGDGEFIGQESFCKCVMAVSGIGAL